MKFKILLILFILCICASGFFILLQNKKGNIENKKIEEIANNTPKEEKIVQEQSKIKVIIEDTEYTAFLENNETAISFANMLPQTFNMSELNGNEKYFYMDKSLPTNLYYPKNIEKGDIMLYENNCIVVFYKSFSTSYGYTKIGHIENMPDLRSDNVVIQFKK